MIQYLLMPDAEYIKLHPECLANAPSREASPDEGEVQEQVQVQERTPKQQAEEEEMIQLALAFRNPPSSSPKLVDDFLGQLFAAKMRLAVEQAFNPPTKKPILTHRHFTQWAAGPISQFLSQVPTAKVNQLATASSVLVLMQLALSRRIRIGSVAMIRNLMTWGSFGASGMACLAAVAWALSRKGHPHEGEKEEGEEGKRRRGI